MLAAAVSAVGLLGASAGTAAKGQPGAVATAVKVVRQYERNGSPAVAYALLDPVQRHLIPRARFIRCTLAGWADNLPRATIRVLGAWTFAVRTRRIPQARGVVVSIVETFLSKPHVEIDPWHVQLVRVEGSWRWLLDWPTVDWYHTHTTICPE